jgi:transcriptional regulator with XRE-family HTH domain
MSQAALAAGAGLDRSYVNRIEAGERGVPAAPAVEALIGALQLSAAEGDRLLAAAGLLPTALRAIGLDDPTVLLLAERLSDASLSPEARGALRATVETIARHWGSAGHTGFTGFTGFTGGAAVAAVAEVAGTEHPGR